jgi:hypothetical protein
MREDTQLTRKPRTLHSFCVSQSKESGNLASGVVPNYPP